MNFSLNWIPSVSVCVCAASSWRRTCSPSSWTSCVKSRAATCACSFSRPSTYCLRTSATRLPSVSIWMTLNRAFKENNLTTGCGCVCFVMYYMRFLIQAVLLCLSLWRYSRHAAYFAVARQPETQHTVISTAGCRDLKPVSFKHLWTPWKHQKKWPLGVFLFFVCVTVFEIFSLSNQTSTIWW